MGDDDWDPVAQGFPPRFAELIVAARRTRGDFHSAKLMAMLLVLVRPLFHLIADTSPPVAMAMCH